MNRFGTTMILALALALGVSADQAFGQRGGARGQTRGQRGQNAKPQANTPAPPPEAFDSLMMLANRAAVQKELNMTDRQKQKVKQLSDDQSKKRGGVYQKIREQTDAASREAADEARMQAMMAAQQANQVDPSIDARGSGTGSQLYGALNNRGGFQPGLYGGSDRVQQDQIDPMQQQQFAQMQARQAAGAVQMESRQVMRAMMQELQHESENALSTALEKPQIKRLKEIQLQVDGVSAVLRDEVAEKLELAEEQVMDIQQVVNQGGVARRQLTGSASQLIHTLAPSPQKADNAQNNRGGRNPRDLSNIDTAALQKAMEKPEAKAQVEKVLKEFDTLRQREYTEVFKVMDRRQVSTFKKLLGKPYDVDGLALGYVRSEPSVAKDAAAAKPGTPKSDAAAKPAGTSKSGSSQKRSTPR